MPILTSDRARQIIELKSQLEEARLQRREAESRAIAAEQRYHDLTVQITAKAFAPPPAPPPMTVTQAEPDAESRAHQRIGTEAISRLAEHLVMQGVDPGMARAEAERLFSTVDVADSGGIDMLGPSGDLDGAFGAPLTTE